jgi:hypothetical protein
MKHDEELMFAGGLRPSRTGLEGKHGTKAESGVMTDTGMLERGIRGRRYRDAGANAG